MRDFTEDDRAQLTSYLDRMRQALTKLEERADDVAAQATPRHRKD
jgi:prefoldin subunit 5